MQLNEETKERLLGRHNALINLARYLEGDTNTFITFLKNVFLFEKNVEQGKELGKVQCDLFGCILQNEYQLRRIIFTQEWQHAMEYFVLSDNASKLVDLFYQLEIGNKSVEGRPAQLRNKLVMEFFFGKGKGKGEVFYGDVPIKFVLSEHVTRWSVESIEWCLEEYSGENRIVGKPVISLGHPVPDGPPQYREIFAVCGAEMQSAGIMASRGAAIGDRSLQLSALDVLRQLSIEAESLEKWVKEIPHGLKNKYESWLKMDLLTREFSTDGFAFLIDLLSFLERSSPEGAQYLKNRFVSFGFSIQEVEKPSGYDFSDEIPKGNIIRSRPNIKYYWIPEDRWEIVYLGKCSFSAGPFPAFLQEIQKLTEAGLLQPRAEDLEKVSEFLLYLELGEKVPNPPLLPIYNALRRWTEALSNQEQYAALEKLCLCTKVFRPHIHILCVGEKPTSLSGREHQLLSKFCPDEKPGTIVGIKQAGIMVPNEKMPLFIPGTYFIAKQSSPLEEFLEQIPPLMSDADESCKNACQHLATHANAEDMVVVLKKILKNMALLESGLWETICRVVDSSNQKGERRIVFFPHRKINTEQFKSLEQNGEFKIKIAHTSKVEEGVIISQEPDLVQAIVVVASGIPPRFIQSLQSLYKWARVKGYYPIQENWIEQILCNFLSFLLEEGQRQEIVNLMTFYQGLTSYPPQVEEDLRIVNKWQRKIEEAFNHLEA